MHYVALTCLKKQKLISTLSTHPFPFTVFLYLALSFYMSIIYYLLFIYSWIFSHMLHLHNKRSHKERERIKRSFLSFFSKVDGLNQVLDSYLGI